MISQSNLMSVNKHLVRRSSFVVHSAGNTMRQAEAQLLQNEEVLFSCLPIARVLIGNASLRVEIIIGHGTIGLDGAAV